MTNDEMMNGQSESTQLDSAQTENGQSAYGQEMEDFYGRNMAAESKTVTSPIIESRPRWLGVLGALGGALLGGIVWTIIGCMGYIYSIVGLLIIYLSYTGYKKLYGSMDSFGILISIVFSLLMVVPATYIANVYYVYEALNEVSTNPYSFFEVFADMPMYMELYELWGDFTNNLVMGYVYMGIGAIMMGAGLFSDKKRSKRNQEEKIK